jgi:hypothetical protein
VDLIGSHIAVFGNGEPDLTFIDNLHFGVESKIAKETNRDKRRILRQEARLVNIANQSISELGDNSQLAVQLLELLAFFRMPVSSDVLVDILSNKMLCKSGSIVIDVEPDALLAELDRLRELRLVERPVQGIAQGYTMATSAVALYRVHPALRSTIQLRISADDTHVLHSAIKEGLS